MAATSSGLTLSEFRVRWGVPGDHGFFDMEIPGKTLVPNQNGPWKIGPNLPPKGRRISGSSSNQPNPFSGVKFDVCFREGIVWSFKNSTYPNVHFFSGPRASQLLDANLKNFHQKPLFSVEKKHLLRENHPKGCQNFRSEIQNETWPTDPIWPKQIWDCALLNALKRLRKCAQKGANVQPELSSLCSLTCCHLLKNLTIDQQ